MSDLGSPEGSDLGSDVEEISTGDNPAHAVDYVTATTFSAQEGEGRLRAIYDSLAEDAMVTFRVTPVRGEALRYTQSGADAANVDVLDAHDLRIDLALAHCRPSTAEAAALENFVREAGTTKGDTFLRAGECMEVTVRASEYQAVAAYLEQKGFGVWSATLPGRMDTIWDKIPTEETPVRIAEAVHAAGADLKEFYLDVSYSAARARRSLQHGGMTGPDKAPERRIAPRER